MNIRQAKDEIKNTITAYLRKDELNRYCIASVHQRPILLMGPPGIGKTAVMEQIASELKIALVSYTMTHHTRQSAIGLPRIETEEFEGTQYSITRYTMSEIIASVYDKIKDSGCKEGILFLDEINCVSETLAPAMLSFLQCKMFGNHKLPEGWVIVAAGNPPEYNRSVRDLDIVTLDRVRRINIEAEPEIFLEYARNKGIHGAILAYLEIKKDAFYRIETEVDGPAYVTARGWEDLSELLVSYEIMQVPVTKEVIYGYLHQEEVAADFANYLKLYEKYQKEYRIDLIFAGEVSKEQLEKLRKASFDEKLSVLTMVIAAISQEFSSVCVMDEYVKELYQDLLSYRERIRLEKAKDEAVLSMLIKKREQELTQRRQLVTLTKQQEQVGLLVIQKLRDYMAQVVGLAVTEGKLTGFSLVKNAFTKETRDRDDLFDKVLVRLEAVFDFIKEAFGEGEEMVIFVTELNQNPDAMQFLSQRECEVYYRYNRELLFDHKREELLQKIDSLS